MICLIEGQTQGWMSHGGLWISAGAAKTGCQFESYQCEALFYRARKLMMFR
jgi:hypothetical protein